MTNLFRLLALLVAAVLPASAVLQASAPDRPNVIYVFTDQQHAGMMSCAGNPWLKTPAMDSIARNGARFERAYSVNPVCVPARTAMLTGHTPSRFGMQSNNELAKTKIPDAVRGQTLGRVFRDAGYETVYGGKTHVPGKITDYGFDVLTGDQREALAGACAAYLKQPHDKPFLLVASFINPHDICYMAINDFGQGLAGKSGPHQACLAEALARPAGVSEADFWAKHCPPAPANLEPQAGAPEAIMAAAFQGFRKHAFETWDEKKWRLHRWAYCRLTERVDREIGQVLDALRQAGLEEKTLIVFSSDHGDMDGSHRFEHKSLFFEEAARVPFVVSFKGVTAPGLVDREHVVSAGLDLIPTLCDYAGIAPPAGLKGRSVRPLAENRPLPAPRPYVVSETHYGRMVCSGRYKYCVYQSGEKREQLVDLQEDPGEMRNLAYEPKYQEIVARHRQFLREWVESNDDTLAKEYLIR